MKQKFCRSCNNILVSNVESNNLLLVCRKCDQSYKHAPEDTLRYTRKIEHDMYGYDRLFRTATEDPCALRAYVDCPECKHNIVCQVRIPNEAMDLFNVCIKCKYIFRYGS